MAIKLKDFQCTRNKQGVYFLYRENGDLCYIGQSTNIYLRILEHIAESSKEFSFFRFIQIEDNDFMELFEVYLISSYCGIFKLYNKLVLCDEFEYFLMYLPSSIRKKYIYEDFVNMENEISADVFRRSEYNQEIKTRLQNFREGMRNE